MNLEAFLIVQETAREWLGIELQCLPIQIAQEPILYLVLWPREDEFAFYKVARSYADSLSCK